MKILKSKSRTGWIGVDVGSHSVKLAQVAEVEGEIQLRQAISIPRQTPWPDDLSQLQIPFSSEEELTVATTLCSSFSATRRQQRSQWPPVMSADWRCRRI